MLVTTLLVILEFRVGSTTPITLLSLAFSLANALGSYLYSSMISWIFTLVDSFTLPPLKYLDTVLLVTPAMEAISSMVIFPGISNTLFLSISCQ